MRTIVVSYSLTGNNETLAACVAAKLGAEHMRVSPRKPRAMKEIALDMLFGRVPAVDPLPGSLPKDAFPVFFSPVWMGKAASPLRAYLRELKAERRGYAFVSISGGADGPGSNARLGADLRSRTGRDPEALVDLHIAEFLPRDPAPTRDDTSAYRLSAPEAERLSVEVAAALKASMRG